MQNSITSVLIGSGALIMVFAILATRQILSLIQESAYAKRWRVLVVLMIFFAAGYVGVIWMIFSGGNEITLTLVGVIFLFGALFVLLVVRVGLATIGELSRVQKNITAARDQALESSRVKSELLGRVSHELRTPLQGVLGFTDILQSGLYGELNDQQANISQRILTNTHELIHQINDFLREAQTSSETIPLTQEPFRPADLIAYAESLIRMVAEEKELDLHTHTDPSLPEILLGDYDRLQNIILNLSQNAVKFTESGMITLAVRKENAETWSIQVQDTGIGIPEEKHAEIFEPFEQIDGSITREHGGMGLGLSITKKMIESMAGTIDVRSAPGLGSTFTVQLPLLEPQGKTT